MPKSSSRALRAVGRIERTLFTLQWLSAPGLRQRSHAGLNKGETSHSLRRAVFFHRQGEIHDRTFENQSFRASGLSLLTAAIVHWNGVKSCVDPSIRPPPARLLQRQPGAEGIALHGVKMPEAKRDFVLLARRWVVERSFAWPTRCRRLVKDYERYASTLA